MQVKIKLFATFRQNRFKEKDFSFDGPVQVGQVVTQLGIPVDEVGVTMINGRHCLMQDTLNDNDILGIFPMIGGG